MLACKSYKWDISAIMQTAILKDNSSFKNISSQVWSPLFNYLSAEAAE